MYTSGLYPWRMKSMHRNSNALLNAHITYTKKSGENLFSSCASSSSGSEGKNSQKRKKNVFYEFDIDFLTTERVNLIIYSRLLFIFDTRLPIRHLIWIYLWTATVKCTDSSAATQFWKLLLFRKCWIYDLCACILLIIVKWSDHHFINEWRK